MMMKKLLYLGLASMIFFGARNARGDNQTSESFATEVVIKVGYPYLLSLPEGYEAEQEKKWPLVVFLHGAGERGKNLEMLKKHGPPKLLAAGQKFPAIIASLQCEPKQVWNPHGVKAITDHLAD